METAKYHPQNNGSVSYRKKGKVWRKYNETESDFDHDKYVKERNKLHRMTQQTVKTLRRVAERISTNPKGFWKYVNSNLNTRIGVGNLIQPDGKETEDDREKGNTPYDYFYLSSQRRI